MQLRCSISRLFLDGDYLFDVKMPVNILLDASTLSAEQMDAELQRAAMTCKTEEQNPYATFADIRKDYPSKTKAL